VVCLAGFNEITSSFFYIQGKTSLLLLHVFSFKNSMIVVS